MAEEQDGISGFVTVWCRPAPFIDNLHVVPDRRTEGIGGCLMQAAAAQLIERGHDTVHLWVAADNHRAIAFYHRLGGRFGERQIQRLYGQEVAATNVVWDDLAGLGAGRHSNVQHCGPAQRPPPNLAYGDHCVLTLSASSADQWRCGPGISAARSISCQLS